MYAIIDIEATGGNPKKDRITEIAIFLHDGNEVTEQFCTLVNPMQEITPFVSVLTGITNEMVAEAPLWEEVAEKVFDITKGRVFVAHNVRFDYSFICNEFKRIGLRFQRKNICTVRLSRAILPGLESYSLGRLCHHVGIPMEHRHRAFGDCAATVELFNLLLKQNSHLIMQDVLKDEINQSILPPNLNREQLKELPEETGVYYFHDEKGHVIYVGKSTNIRQRVISHFSEDLNSAKHLGLKNKITDITWNITGNELLALLLESSEIKRWMPTYNRAMRRKKFRFGIYEFFDEEGYHCLNSCLIKQNEMPLMAFGSKGTSERVLLHLVEKYNLCLKRCNLNLGVEMSCPQCGEAHCQEMPDAAMNIKEYNEKVAEALASYRYEQGNFIIAGEGRKPQERSFIMVEDGKFSGYGFVEENEAQIASFDVLKEYLNPLPDHPDLHKVIRSFIKKKKKNYEVIYS